MNAKQIVMSLVLGGAAIYFFFKYLPDLERLFESGSSLFFTLLLLFVLGYMIYKVLRS